MPTYQYACTNCGQQLEVVQKFSDEPLTECPSCAGRLRKVFAAVGVVFKGSGFYKTDSRSSTKKSSESTAGKDDKPAGSTSGDSGSSSSSTTTTSSTSSASSSSSPSSSPSSSSGQVA